MPGEGFRYKPPEELAEQLKTQTERVGQDITPPSAKLEVEKMSLTEIKENFPKRYEIYLELLRKTDDELTEFDVRHISTWLQMLNSLDAYIEHHQTAEATTLREHQFSVFEDLRDFLEQGEKEGYVKLPTGTGKTVIFAEFIETLNVRSLIVVPTKILIRQTGQRIEQFAGDIDVGKIYSDAKEHKRQVTITTYDSLVAGVRNGTIKPDDYDCLILDEAHKALTEK